jgi:hypothetical protein
LETKKVEELYSFKTMRRLLYQAWIVILKEVSNAVPIHYLSFPSSWIQFADSLYQVHKNETEETGLIEVAESFILFEEFMETRKMLVIAKIKPTSATKLFPGEGTRWCILYGLYELLRRGQHLQPFNGAYWESCLRSLTINETLLH